MNETQPQTKQQEHETPSSIKVQIMKLTGKD